MPKKHSRHIQCLWIIFVTFSYVFGMRIYMPHFVFYSVVCKHNLYSTGPRYTCWYLLVRFEDKCCFWGGGSLGARGETVEKYTIFSVHASCVRCRISIRPRFLLSNLLGIRSKLYRLRHNRIYLFFRFVPNAFRYVICIRILPAIACNKKKLLCPPVLKIRFDRSPCTRDRGEWGEKSKTACRPPRDYAARLIIYINTVLSCWSRRCVCARVRVCTEWRTGSGGVNAHTHTSARARGHVHGAPSTGRDGDVAERGGAGRWGKRVIDTKPTAPALLAGPCQIIHARGGDGA